MTIERIESITQHLGEALSTIIFEEVGIHTGDLEVKDLENKVFEAVFNCPDLESGMVDVKIKVKDGNVNVAVKLNI